jgi:hypothetical protein
VLQAGKLHAPWDQRIESDQLTKGISKLLDEGGGHVGTGRPLPYLPTRNEILAHAKATFAKTPSIDVTAHLSSGDVVAEAAKLHQEDMSRLRSYDDDVLRKTVRFAGDDTIWSVMGFLWSLYAHRAYHLGNIDIYIRQADVPAPDFYSFQPKEMA